MWVSALRLTDFRSYASVDLTFEPGPTLFVGANGQGKTNLVEAIAYTSVLGSHRVSSDAPLVRAGCERAIVGVTAQRGDRAALVELEINPGKANRARLNRASATRARDVLGIVTTVLFAPEDLALVKGDPSDRRRFIDELMIQRTPRMQGVRSDYDRILKQRNALLKSAYGARRTSMEQVSTTLEIWDEQLATVGAEIIAARIALLAAMSDDLMTWYRLIAGADSAVSSPDLTAHYVTSLRQDPGPITRVEDWRSALISGLTDRRREELDRGLTLVGPQRDDIGLVLGGLPAKGYASHGESWSIALALRLASFDVLRSEGEEPVLILDDVFAELDSTRRQRLGGALLDGAQVLVTAAVAEDVPAELQGPRLVVERGRVLGSAS